jgi:hypothetical protein
MSGRSVSIGVQKPIIRSRTMLLFLALRQRPLELLHAGACWEELRLEVHVRVILRRTLVGHMLLVLWMV